MNKKKIFNDPLYGFISIPYDLIFDLIEHPYFQRLRRIGQLSLTHYVYPGAHHTRFHHALGAMHLTTKAIEVLRAKGTEITNEEAEAVTAAILLHDIGHGPFSHTLEHTLIPVHHETLTLALMRRMNTEFDGKLTLAIEIFENRYSKAFLHQLVSGQLDMDRMDYLNRDSYYTGVHEGVVSHDRIIQMLAVVGGELVVEEKGIYSVEKFLVARRLMYWQVYLHKTVVCAEQMLIQAIKVARRLVETGEEVGVTQSLQRLLSLGVALGTEFDNVSSADVDTFASTNVSDDFLDLFADLDDTDIYAALKTWAKHPHPVLRFLSNSILERKLFKVEWQHTSFEAHRAEELAKKVQQKLLNTFATEKGYEYLSTPTTGEKGWTQYLVFEKTEINRTYQVGKDEIKILHKNGYISPMSETFDYMLSAKTTSKYFLFYPKRIHL